MEEAINNGLTAEAAVEKVQNDNRARMNRQQDPYLRDRLHDFDDLANGQDIAASTTYAGTGSQAVYDSEMSED